MQADPIPITPNLGRWNNLLNGRIFYSANALKKTADLLPLPAQLHLVRHVLVCATAADPKVLAPRLDPLG
jgi:hypothetical protein